MARKNSGYVHRTEFERNLSGDSGTNTSVRTKEANKWLSKIFLSQNNLIYIYSLNIFTIALCTKPNYNGC